MRPAHLWRVQTDPYDNRKPISNRVLRFRSWPATLAGWNDLPYASGSYYFFSGRQRVGSRSGSDPVLNSGSASRGRTKLR